MIFIYVDNWFALVLDNPCNPLSTYLYDLNQKIFQTKMVDSEVLHIFSYY